MCVCGGGEWSRGRDEGLFFPVLYNKIVFLFRAVVLNFPDAMAFIQFLILLFHN